MSGLSREVRQAVGPGLAAAHSANFAVIPNYSVRHDGARPGGGGSHPDICLDTAAKWGTNYENVHNKVPLEVRVHFSRVSYSRSGISGNDSC